MNENINIATSLGMTVNVYRNLNCRTHTEYSIQAPVLVDGTFKRRVAHRMRSALLRDCTFKHASDKQAWRCKHGGKKGTGCREVCQWIRTAQPPTNPTSRPIVQWKRMVCDPKTAVGFRGDDGNLLTHADYVLLKDDGSAWYANEEQADA